MVKRYYFKGKNFTLMIRDSSECVYPGPFSIRFYDNAVEEMSGVRVLAAEDLTVDEVVEAIQEYAAKKSNPSVQGSTSS